VNFVVAIFNSVAQSIVIALASPYIALGYPGILGLFYFVQKYYLRTSRQLRFMDIEAKSPLYTQFLESLSGLVTIRAFGWQEANHALNAELLDKSQRPFYLLFMIQRWLTLVMDLIGMILALIVVGIAVQTRASISPGFAGVSLLNLISFTDRLKWLIMSWTLLETSIGAVSRVKSFAAETASENLPREIDAPPAVWPSRGLIEIEKLSAAYSVGKDTLHEVSLTIRPGEKIAIVGRSGSGKSSMVLALFRMIELTGGRITIDDVDISTVPRQDVRSCLNAVPQDSYFLHGTIRTNLDPWETQTDNKLEEVLKRVQLWAAIESRGGIDALMDVDLLSHGQRQLFCLARAILRPGKIVVLDEATSRYAESQNTVI
jgi:ATP-binding cassette subfamily C (CFTR/MRP) protein 1